jgi:hypothetical protein
MSSVPPWLAAGLTALILGLPVKAGSEVYRWTDERGVEHFATSVEKVPFEQRAAAKDRARQPGGTVNHFSAPDRAEEDLSAPPARGSASGPWPAARAPEAGSDDRYGGRPEADWRRDYQRLADEIEGLEAQAKDCEGIHHPRAPNPWTGRGMKRQHFDRREARAEACDTVRSQLAARQRQLEGFRQRAHRAGVPPGVVR